MDLEDSCNGDDKAFYEEAAMVGKTALLRFFGLGD